MMMMLNYVDILMSCLLISGKHKQTIAHGSDEHHQEGRPFHHRGPANSSRFLVNSSYRCMIFVKGRENGTHFPVELTISGSSASLTVWKGAISSVKWWLDWQNSSYWNSIFHKKFLLE
jgi:hypothetical protein